MWMILCLSRLPMLLKIRPQISQGWMYLWRRRKLFNGAFLSTGRCRRLVWTLLLHRGVRQLLPVDDQVSVVGGLQGKAPVTDATAVALLLVLLQDVLQVLSAFGKGQLQRDTRESHGCGQEPVALPMPPPERPHTKTHLAFFAVVLVMPGVVFFLVILQVIAVIRRNADLPDESVPLLLVHQGYVLTGRRRQSNEHKGPNYGSSLHPNQAPAAILLSELGL